MFSCKQTFVPVGQHALQPHCDGAQAHHRSPQLVVIERQACKRPGQFYVRKAEHHLERGDEHRQTGNERGAGSNGRSVSRENSTIAQPNDVSPSANSKLPSVSVPSRCWSRDVRRIGSDSEGLRRLSPCIQDFRYSF